MTGSETSPETDPASGSPTGSPKLTCPACGHHVDAAARFCESCGMEFRPAASEPVSPAEPVAPGEPVAPPAPVAPVEPVAAPEPAAPAAPTVATTPSWGAHMDPFEPLRPPDDEDGTLLAPAVLVTDFEPGVGAEVAAPSAVAPSDPATAPTGLPAQPLASPEAPTAPIGQERPCARCGGSIARDGYCELCGEPAASERDHYRESPAAWVGGTCDRGVVHTKNEDAMSLGVLDPEGDVAVIVVCDGVSSAPDSDVASLAAARAASTVILDGIRNAAAPSAEQIRELSGLLGRAAVVGNEAVVATTPADRTEQENPPSCTFVAAAIDGPLVVTAWLGDSRAYWLPDDGAPRQLSVDHSWAQEAIEQGMPRFEAERARHAHAITRWLGADAPDLTVRSDAMVAHGAGWVLVCSDGLWNYCSPAADLASLLRTVVADVGTDPTAISAELVTWANAQGGRDNITVALARLDPVRHG
ncbi:protein phosphatase 2C domain-containing protein [Serinibacter arcticus]|uniref:Protein serine/threonine phosphatase PrpC, regulation of stationary phase n=1 Tax=Serinibacter arcticus TaxID=1655435 RepID=A0A4Z1E0X6_9MICO|nr:protein phosphatase 2C domain-containing protein [Serinibacter arcticus]TGO05595.1 Protein serine/threonine phosphatase PrpC, regulation of stationary phase [Serinibacter arcticus]